MSKLIGAVVVPFILTKEQFLFAADTTISLFGLRSEHKLLPIAVVNGCATGLDDLNWFKKSYDICIMNDRNNLARAWNIGIKKAFEQGCDYVLVCNLDLFFHSRFLDNLIHFADGHPDYIIWSGTEWKDRQTLEQAELEGEIPAEAHFSCFLINRRLFEIVGEFDEQFEPAYHEDSDMRYRIKLAQQKMGSSNSARFFHLDRATLKGALAAGHQEFLDTTRKLMDSSMEKYCVKWGGLPGQEKFSTPYNK